MRTSLLSLWLFSLVACGPDAPSFQQARNNSKVPGELSSRPKRHDKLPAPPAPPPPPQLLPGIIALSDASIHKEFGPGARCSLVEHGAPVLVATLTDALVNVDGRLIHLTSGSKTWHSLRLGGRFTAQDLVIEVTARSLRTRRGELIQRDTDLKMTRGQRAFSVFHGPPWVCNR